MLSRLPDFVRIVRGFFVTEKKAALPMEDVIKKLVDSHPSRLPPGQLGVRNVSIAREFPFVNYRITPSSKKWYLYSHIS